MPTDDNALHRPITLRARDGAFIPLRRAAFEVTVDGPHVTTRATVSFHNETGRAVEADLVLPLPPFASVRSLHARWGQRALDGVVRGREAARGEYAAAVAQGHAAALAEGEGEDLARLRIAPIEPDADVEVTLTLLHGAAPTMEGHRIVVPLTYMPRYVESADALTATEAAALDRPRPVTLDARAEVTLRVRGVDPARVRCASHRTQTTEATGETRVQIDEVPLDRDVVVEVLDRPTTNDPIVLLRRGSGDGPDGAGPCALATLVPPAFADEGPTTPRTVIFLVDRSGSMGGGPMASAKRAVRGSLRALTPEDRFNIIAFDDALEALGSTTLPFTDATLSAADRFTDALDARGGTEASAALRAVMTDTPKKAKVAWKEKGPPDARARLRLVVFMTDGDVAGAAEVLRAAKESLRNTRVHVLGIGDSVNHALLGEIAAVGGGTYTPVATDEDLERALAHLKNALYAPVWTSVEAQIERGGARLALGELEPGAPWDLFARAPVTFAWRGATAPGDVLRVAGYGPDGAERVIRVPLDGAREDAEAHARWATMRARRLTYRFDEGDDAALEALGTAYGLITRRTSLLAVDPNDSGARVEASVPVSFPMPANVAQEMARGAFGAGAVASMAMPMASMAMPSMASPGAPPPPASRSAAKSKGSFLKKAAKRIGGFFSGGAPPPPAEAEMDDAALHEEASDYDTMDAMPADPFSAGAPPPAPTVQPPPAREALPTDERAALRALMLDQRADGLFGDIAQTLASVAALVSRGHTPREGDFRAELKRTLATLRARVDALSGEEQSWARLAVALLTVPHGAEPEGLDAAQATAARAVRIGDTNGLQRSVIALLALAPPGWDAGARAAAIRRALLA